MKFKNEIVNDWCRQEYFWIESAMKWEALKDLIGFNRDHVYMDGICSTVNYNRLIVLLVEVEQILFSFYSVYNTKKYPFHIMFFLIILLSLFWGNNNKKPPICKSIISASLIYIL